MITKERADKFVEVVKSFTEDVSIFITQYDPDAQASAFTIKKIIEKFIKKKLKVHIYYDKIQRRQNKKIADAYNLESFMRKFSNSKLNELKNIVLVDSSRIEDGRLSFNGHNLPDPVIIIDHHKKTEIEENENQFYIIEPVAACSTLLIELANILDINFKDYDDIPLPDLLTLGIYTDTKALFNTTERDEEAYFSITQLADRTTVKQLLKVKYPLTFLDHRAFALNNVKHDKGILVTGIGIVNPSDADYISDICDGFTNLENITISIVWGIIENRIRVSARGDTSLEEFLNKTIGDKSGVKILKDLTAEGGGIIDFDMGDLGQFILINETTEEEFLKFIIILMREIFQGKGTAV